MSVPLEQTRQMIKQFCRDYSHLRSLKDYPLLNEEAKAYFGDEVYMLDGNYTEERPYKMVEALVGSKGPTLCFQALN